MREFVVEERTFGGMKMIFGEQMEVLYFEVFPLLANPLAVRSRPETGRGHGWEALVQGEAQDLAVEKFRSILEMTNRGRRWSWHDRLGG